MNDAKKNSLFITKYRFQMSALQQQKYKNHSKQRQNDDFPFDFQFILAPSLFHFSHSFIETAKNSPFYWIVRQNKVEQNDIN